jgi:hypothetical protein
MIFMRIVLFCLFYNGQKNGCFVKSVKERMKKTFNSILDRMTHLLNELGIAYDMINRDSEIYRTQTEQYEQAIRTKKDGQTFEVIVQATRLAETIENRKYQRASVPRFHPLAFDWSIVFSVILSENNSNLTLVLTKETATNKLTKLLWKRDLEVFNEAFDATFWIKSNNSYAYGMLLDAALQEQLLASFELFGTLEIQENRIHYKESLLKEKELEATTIKKHYKSMLAICLTLAKKVEVWKPPLDS